MARIVPFAWTLVFSALAVWGILLNGFFVSGNGLLAGYEPVVFLCICLLAAVLFSLVARASFRSRVSLMAVSVAVGVGMPAVVILLPMVFCVVFQCRGFNLP